MNQGRVTNTACNLVVRNRAVHTGRRFETTWAIQHVSVVISIQTKVYAASLWCGNQNAASGRGRTRKTSTYTSIHVIRRNYRRVSVCDGNKTDVIAFGVTRRPQYSIQSYSW